MFRSGSDLAEETIREWDLILFYVTIFRRSGWRDHVVERGHWRLDFNNNSHCLRSGRHSLLWATLRLLRPSSRYVDWNVKVEERELVSRNPAQWLVYFSG